MVQMTHLASFGPAIVVASQPNHMHPFVTWIRPK